MPAHFFQDRPGFDFIQNHQVYLKRIKKMDNESEIKEENKKIKTLRLLVDTACLALSQGGLNREESWEMVEKVKQWALILFPGKEETFDLLYLPRFRRIIEERYPLH